MRSPRSGENEPRFGSVHPEPIAKYLGAPVSAISSGMGDFGIVTDGDADRIGAMDERATFVDPHKIMALSLKYLVEKRGWTGSVVRTVSTTHDRPSGETLLPPQHGKRRWALITLPIT